MNEIFKKFKNEKMTESEKQTGLNRLQAFMTANPVQSPWYTTFGNKIVSPFQNGMLLHHKMLASAFVLVLLVSVTGGTSIAARYSLPGDILYPVKINVNEKVETFTAYSSEAKATVEAGHVNERLTEAEQLSTVNKLNENTKAEISAQFSQDLKATMTHIETLNSTGNEKSATQVKVNIEASLQKHRDIVNQIISTKKASSRIFNAKMQQPSNNTTQVATPPENQNPIAPQAQTMLMSVQADATTVAATTTTNAAFKMKLGTDTDVNQTQNSTTTPLLDETLNTINFGN